MSRVDRSRLPVPGPDRPFHFPTVARQTLPNGLELRAVRHRAVPLVSLTLLVPGGASVDPSLHPGLVSMTAGLLDEGSGGQSAIEVADRVARIGGDLDLDVGADAVVVSLTTLDRFFETGLALVHEMVTAPTLSTEDFDRIRRLRIERIHQLKDHASAMADRAFATALYGSHPYGHLGIGTEASLASMEVSQTRALHAALFVPAGSTLVIVGDRPTTELLDVASRVFGSWTAGPSALDVDRAAALAPPPPAPSLRLGVVSRAGAAQSEVRIGQVCASRSTPDYPALLMLNSILGGQFVSRINLNLRQDKGYTYCVRTGFDLRRGRGPFVLQTSVGTDVTAAAVREALGELRDIAGPRPATAEELALACASVVKGYPRGFETAIQVARSVAQLALHGLPDSYFEEFIPRLEQVTVDDVTRVARRYLDTSTMATVIVGDLDKIAEPLTAIGLGAPTVLGAEF